MLLLALIPAYFIAAWLLPLFAGSEVDNMLHRLREGAPDAHSRLVLWRNVLDLIAQHPWAGWGWGELSFAHYSTLYSGPRFVEILDNAHNLPLHLAVELGIPAALLICGGFGWLVLAARPWRETDPARLMAWGLLGAIVLHSLLEYPLWYGPFQLVFGLCLGFLWPGLQKARSKRQCGAFPCSSGGRVGNRRLRRLGLHPHQPDLPRARRSPAGLARRHAGQAPGLLAVRQPGEVRRTDAHAGQRRQRGRDARVGARAFFTFRPSRASSPS